MKATRKWVRAVNLAFSLAVTAGVMVYFFGSGKTSIAQIKGMLRNVYLPALCLFVAVSMTMNVLRTIRYAVILRAAGLRPPSIPMFLVVLVRGMFVDLLPARLGELVYIYVLRTRLGIPLGAATASFALAFLFDLIALAPLIMAAVVLVGAAAGVSTLKLLLATGFLLAASCATLMWLPSLLRLVFGILGIRGLGKNALAGRLRRFAASIGFQVKKSRKAGIYLPVLGLSILVRLAKYTGMYVMFYALVRSYGYDLASLPPAKVFLAMCSSEMAASMPWAGVMGIGAYEGTWHLVLVSLGFPQNVAATSGVCHHMLTQLYGYSLGALALLALFLTGARGTFTRDSRDGAPVSSAM